MDKTIKSGIYCIKNTVNGKVYIGSSMNLAVRLRNHFLRLSRSNHANERLERAWAKYGEKSFAFSVLEYVEDVKLLLVREQHWIDFFDAAKTGYNICPNAGNHRGRPMSDEARKKISEALKGRPRDPEAAAKGGLAHRGKVVSEDTRKKLAAISAGKTHSQETRNKISKITKGRIPKPMTPAHCANISAAKRGKKLGPPSDEHRAKLSEAAKKRGISPETQAKMLLARARGREKKLQDQNMIG